MRARKLTERQLNLLIEKIEEEKSGLIFKDVYTSEEFNVSEDERADEVDQANAAVSSAQRLRFRNRETFYQKKLISARERIRIGDYGDCEDCGEPIGFKRLIARPTADLCISCKEESERDESSNWVSRQSKSLGSKIQMINSI